MHNVIIRQLFYSAKHNFCWNRIFHSTLYSYELRNCQFFFFFFKTESHFFLPTGEHNSLLGNHHGASNSDISTHLCEIDDSECEQEISTATTASTTTTKTVKWAPSVQSTQVWRILFLHYRKYKQNSIVINLICMILHHQYHYTNKEQTENHTNKKYEYFRSTFLLYTIRYHF